MPYIPIRKAAERLGVCADTLRRYAADNKIPYIITEGGHRRFDVDAYLSNQSTPQTICYCRVSSSKQKPDLNRQIAYMQSLYPDAEIISDIASGVNFKRKGLNTILERLCNGDKLNIVVAHKDRLARISFDLIDFMVKQNGGKIVVLNQNEKNFSPEREFVSDILAILHSFSSRLHGLRRYHKEIKKDFLPTKPIPKEAN